MNTAPSGRTGHPPRASVVAGRGEPRRARGLARLVALLALLLWGLAGEAQTAWPGYIHALQPDLSESPRAAVLPPDAGVTPPAADLPAARARWSGTWQGWACSAQACDVKVAVQRIDRTGASVVYAAASADGSSVYRGEALFVGDELQFGLQTGAKLVLRLRADGDMEMSLWGTSAQLLAAGVLTQLPLPSRRRSVERIATPWAHDGQPVSLVLLVYRPGQGAGPWPTLVVNHGSTGEGDRPELFRQVFTNLALVRQFTARGWQVIFPQRRGRGGSGGIYDEGFLPDHSRYSCEPADTLPGFQRALGDLHVVMQHLVARPDVDARRLVLAGVSRGGVLATAYAGIHPEHVAGVINIVGGWLGDRCPQAQQVNSLLFRDGASFPRATLWLYGDQDRFYTLAHSRASFAAFRDAGGKGRFVAYEVGPGEDGHAIAERPDLWQTDVREYLTEVVPP